MIEFDIYYNGSYYGCEYGYTAEEAIARVAGEHTEGFTAEEGELGYVA